MKKLVTVLAVAALMTSCQKENVQDQVSIKIYTVDRMFLDVAEESLQDQACSPVDATEVGVSINTFSVNSNGHIVIKEFNGNSTHYNSEFVDNYEVTNISIDGEGVYYTEALRLYDGDVITDNYILLIDFCDEDKLTLYSTDSEVMMYSTRN
tara:strand:+ start:471 stop:926 length:456 start_codon:yes stop_codon:yes gene_type:complete